MRGKAHRINAPFDGARHVKKTLLLLSLTAALLAGGVWFVQRPRHPVLSEKNLSFAPFLKGTMHDVVSATGILEPRDLVLVGSELPGTLQDLHGRINDVVMEGTLLATLDDRKFKLKVEEAQNGLATANAALAQAIAAKEGADIAVKTQQELASRGGFRTDLDQAKTAAKVADAGRIAAEAKVKVAETQVREAKIALDQTQIRVPMSSSQGGKRTYVILDRKVSVGQAVGPAAGPLFVLAGDFGMMEVHAQVAEGDVTRVRKGLAAVFTLKDFADDDVEFRGIVREIRPLGNNARGAVAFDTVIDVANQKDPASGDWRLRPAMTASIDIVRVEHKDVWKIPREALDFKLDDAYQDDAIKARLAEWQRRSDAGLWVTAWTWDAARNSVWPVFVRVLGNNGGGEPGIKDSEGNEVLEWESSAASGNPPRLIIKAPPARPPGIFDQPANLKVS
jgi:multidrug efflux pump subunit AcrA (membrane-fusion protein)